MNRSLTIFLACAFGASIGTLIALQFGPAFWWLGALLGGLAAYLAYDLHGVSAGVTETWKSLVLRPPTWGGVKMTLQVIAAVTVTLAVLVAYLSSWYFPMIWLTPLTASTDPPAWIVGVIILPFMFCVGLWIAEDNDFEKTLPAWLFFLLLVLWPTPLGLLGLITYALVKLLLFSVKFSWQLFRLIHSDLRLLCGCDATIGAVIGYAIGNALLGAVAGGLIGWLNYEFVSVRWLKLIPAKA